MLFRLSLSVLIAADKGCTKDLKTVQENQTTLQPRSEDVGDDAHLGMTLVEMERPWCDQRGRSGSDAARARKEKFFHPAAPRARWASREGSWQPGTDRRTRRVCSGDAQQRPYKLNTQVFFQLMQGTEEQNEDYYYLFFISLQEIFILN